jgi:hypothetical protein
MAHSLASMEQERLRLTEQLLHSDENLTVIRSDLCAMKERCVHAESQLGAKDDEIKSLQKIEVISFPFSRFVLYSKYEFCCIYS